MSPSDTSTSLTAADVVVSGAGSAGLLAAVALAKSGWSVICAGPIDARPTGRTVALFEGSLRFLRQIDVWHRFAARAQPIKAITMIDDTGPFLPVPNLTLNAAEIELDALGSNVEIDRLIQGLVDEAATLPNLTLTRDRLATVDFEDERVRVTGEDGRVFTGRLIVAADGRRSLARLRARIAARAWHYPQVAITALLSHRKPHNGCSTEFHTRAGPCTLVPLKGTEAEPHRSSLVWLMSPREGDRRRALDDDAFALELQHQTRSIVGRLKLEPARGFFPMGGLRASRLAGPRIALIGEAAHAFPPLAAQGLNLTLRDVAQLVATLGAARARNADIGAGAVLADYERARRRDVALRTSGVDVLNRSIMTDFAAVDAIRGAGTIAVRLIGPLRRALLREGIVPPGPVA